MDEAAQLENICSRMCMFLQSVDSVFFFISLVSVGVEECKRASTIVGALVLRNEPEARRLA